jgi:hypothetical protein
MELISYYYKKVNRIDNINVALNKIIRDTFYEVMYSRLDIGFTKFEHNLSQRVEEYFKPLDEFKLQTVGETESFSKGSKRIAIYFKDLFYNKDYRIACEFSDLLVNML